MSRRQPPWGRTTKDIVYTLRMRGKWEVGEGLSPPLGESCVQTTKDNKADACTGERENPHRKKEVVYEVACKDCDQKYIGETKRTMKKRLTEHKYAVCRGDEKNGIAVHANKFNHSVDWESARVLRIAQGYWNRRTLEAIQIQRTICPINLDCGLHLSPVWNPLLIDHTWTINTWLELFNTWTTLPFDVLDVSSHHHLDVISHHHFHARCQHLFKHQLPTCIHSVLAADEGLRGRSVLFINSLLHPLLKSFIDFYLPYVASVWQHLSFNRVLQVQRRTGTNYCSSSCHVDRNCLKDEEGNEVTVVQWKILRSTRDDDAPESLLVSLATAKPWTWVLPVSFLYSFYSKRLFHFKSAAWFTTLHNRDGCRHGYSGSDWTSRGFLVIIAQQLSLSSHHLVAISIANVEASEWTETDSVVWLALNHPTFAFTYFLTDTMFMHTFTTYFLTISCTVWPCASSLLCYKCIYMHECMPA